MSERPADIVNVAELHVVGRELQWEGDVHIAKAIYAAQQSRRDLAQVDRIYSPPYAVVDVSGAAYGISWLISNQVAKYHTRKALKLHTTARDRLLLSSAIETVMSRPTD